MMAGIALSVAIAALIIAGLSAWFALRATRAAERQAQAAEAVIHDARKPDIGLAVEIAPGTTTNGDLIVTHLKGPDLDRIDVEIVLPAPGEPRPVPVPGFYPGVGIWTKSIDGLPQAHSRRVPVNINPHPPRADAMFVLTCQAGGEQWSIPRRVKPDWGPPLVAWG